VTWQRGDRIALVRTDGPATRLRPGDQGTVTRWDPALSQLDVRWDSGSTLSMLPGEGDQVRLLASAASDDPPGQATAREANAGRDAGEQPPARSSTAAGGHQ
jgi:uncharacterized protein DUF4314